MTIKALNMIVILSILTLCFQKGAVVLAMTQCILHITLRILYGLHMFSLNKIFTGRVKIATLKLLLENF